MELKAISDFWSTMYGPIFLLFYKQIKGNLKGESDNNLFITSHFGLFSRYPFNNNILLL